MDETGFVPIKIFGHQATTLTNIHPMSKRLKYVIAELNLLEKDVLLDVKVIQIKRYRLRDMDRLTLTYLLTYLFHGAESFLRS
jgi:hypothetical protein